jgi:hypothetical protein
MQPTPVTFTMEGRPRFKTQIDKPPNKQESMGIGSARGGLSGPFAFPFEWRRQRSHLRSPRKAAHRMLGIKDIPFFVEASPVPVKTLRHLLGGIARRIREHYVLDIGPAFFDVFGRGVDGAAGDEAVVDLANIDVIAGYSREGSRMLVERLRAWFSCRWAELQARAIANGRYFPPPLVLRARVGRVGDVRMEAGFAHGFLPGDLLFTLCMSRAAQYCWTGLLRADEPLPLAAGLHGLLMRCARRFARPGERVWMVDDIGEHLVTSGVCSAMREGDGLTARMRQTDWSVVELLWNGILIGTAKDGRPMLRFLLKHRVTPGLRVIRMGVHGRHEYGRMAYALYGYGEPPELP